MAKVTEFSSLQVLQDTDIFYVVRPTAPANQRSYQVSWGALKNIIKSDLGILNFKVGKGTTAEMEEFGQTLSPEDQAIWTNTEKEAIYTYINGEWV